jgi:hypothetical protein
MIIATACKITLLLYIVMVVAGRFAVGEAGGG